MANLGRNALKFLKSLSSSLLGKYAQAPGKLHQLLLSSKKLDPVKGFPPLRGPQNGFNGRVLLASEENGSSKIGVRFDRSIPQAASLRLESASSSEAERLAINDLFRVAIDGSERCSLVLFLEVIEKFLLNTEARGALMSKLESLPENVNVVIIDWHTQMEQGSHGRMHNKSKETPRTVKQITRLFPNEVLIQMPQDESLLFFWKQKLECDVESLSSDSNLVTMRSDESLLSEWKQKLDRDVETLRSDSDLVTTFNHCAAGSLHLEPASSSEAERLAIDELFRVAIDESKRCSLVMFLEVIEKFLLHTEARGAFMSKLESLPENVNVVIIDWHTQMDNQKEQYILGASPFTKFGSNQTSLLDDFRGSYGRMHNKSKETPRTVKQITRLFPNEVLIQMHQDESLLSEWKQKLDRNVETLRSDTDLVTAFSHCAVGSLRLESASSGEAERLAIDELFRVAIDESKRCLLVLFLEVIEKYLLNTEARGAFMSKLESLPENVTVVIIDWHPQMDNQKEQYNLGASPLAKFGSNQTYLLDAFRGSHGRMHNKSKETQKTVKQITRLFPNEVLIQLPQNESLLSVWKQKLERNVESLRSDSNLVTVRSNLNRTAMVLNRSVFGSSFARSFHGQAFSHSSGPNHSAHGSDCDDNARVIYVKFMPLFMTKDIVRQHFTQFGTIKAVLKTGEIRCDNNKGDYSYAFIEYLEKIGADNAIQASGMYVGRKRVKIQRRTSKRYSPDPTAPKQTFSDKLEVFNEFVFSLPKYQLQQPFLHGKWSCNIVDGNIVSLKGNRVRRNFEAEVRKFINNTFPEGTAREMFWRAPAGMSPLNFWTHEVLVHNVYKGRIFRKNFFEECVETCLPFLQEDGEKSLATLIKNFKMRVEMEKGLHFKRGKQFDLKTKAVGLFQEVAGATYGVKVRITEKNDHIDLGFLQNSRKCFVDHVRNQPYGINLEQFHTFFGT